MKNKILRRIGFCVFVFALSFFLNADVVFSQTASGGDNSGPIPQGQEETSGLNPEVGPFILDLKTEDFRINKENYDAGEKVEGSVRIINESEFYESGIYYEMSIYRSLSQNGEILMFDRNSSYDFERVKETINFVPKESKVISFSYPIPKFFPGGDYHFVLKVLNSRENQLAQVNKKINVRNSDENKKFVFIDEKQSKVFGIDKAYKTQEGPTFEFDKEYSPYMELASQEFKPEYAKLKNQVKAEIFFRNEGRDLKNSKLKLSFYKYGNPNNPIQEKIIDQSNFPEFSSSNMTLTLPIFPIPGAYDAVLQFYDQEEPISNPMKLRYLTSGDGGMINSFILKKDSDNRYAASILAFGPADIIYNSENRDLKYKVLITGFEEGMKKKCFESSQEMDLKKKRYLENGY
jgi:hypothetical protein